MIARWAETLQRDFTLAERLRLEHLFGALWDEMDGAAMHFADRRASAADYHTENRQEAA